MINNNLIEIENFGYDKLHAYYNMAIDEWLFNYIIEKNITNKLFVRTYDFLRSAVILGRNDDISNIKRSDNYEKNYDLTRRETGGMPIYVGDETFSYSIIGNLSFLKNNIITVEIHKLLGPVIVNALEELIPQNKEKGNFEVGNKYSVKFKNKPIAGNSSNISNKTFLYHGVITVSKLDADKISTLINLNKEDYESIKQLPYLSEEDLAAPLDAIAIKEKLKKSIPSNICNLQKSSNNTEGKEVQLHEIDNNFKNLILKNANVIADNKYNNKEWINKDKENLKSGRGYCLLYQG